MKRNLPRQMAYEWRSNLWMVIEFIIVSVVIWYICDYFYTSYQIYNQPNNFDTEHCYLLSQQAIEPQNPNYNPDAPSVRESRIQMLERLSRLPEVEAASYSNNAYPYNNSNSGIRLIVDTLYSGGTFRRGTPDFVRVFRYRGANGETPEELKELLIQGSYLISDNFFGKEHSLSKLDRTAVLTEDSIRLPMVTSVLPVKYSDYNNFDTHAFLAVNTSDDGDFSWWNYLNELCIRVRPEMDHNIRERIMSIAQTELHVGNLIINDVQSFKEIRKRFNRDDNMKQRNYIACMAFILLIIFMGLLGTFWFRTQQRVSEIAIRKVCGASPRQIFGRLVSEGLLLLILATPVAVGIDLLLAHNSLNSAYNDYLEWPRMIACVVAAFALVALMVTAGILFPAWHAQKIQPALALKDE